MPNVKEVEWQGGIYNIADETARGEAQQARALANAAQTTAERALTAAGNAQNAAGAAQDTADDAQNTADAAKDTADDVFTQFTNYKELKSEMVYFGQSGIVIFKKRGNVCQISIRGSAISPGTYNVPIPQGFTPLSENFKPGFLLSSGADITGYWTISETVVTLHIPTLANVNAQQTFLM